MTPFPQQDTSWKVAAIFRCCVRYGKDRAWAEDMLAKKVGGHAADRLGHIWFDKRPIFSTIQHAQAYHRGSLFGGRPDVPVAGYKPNVIENARELYLERQADLIADIPTDAPEF